MSKYFIVSVSDLAEYHNCQKCQREGFRQISKIDYECLDSDVSKFQTEGNISSDSRASGIIVHQIMEWVLKNGIDGLDERIGQVYSAMSDLSNGILNNSLAHYFLKDLLPNSIHDARVQKVVSQTIPMLRRLESYLNRTNPELIETERDVLLKCTVGTNNIAIIGRVDLILKSKGKNELVEYKTGDWTNEHKWWFQLAAYASCLTDVVKITIIHPNQGKSKRIVDNLLRKNLNNIFSDECEHLIDCQLLNV